MSGKLERFMGTDLLSIWADGELLLVSVSGGFRDYSFVVFPFAKAYEGFLKKLFFQVGAINKWQYENDRWRVGRALNPQLEKDLRHAESVYDRLVEYCGKVAAHSEENPGVVVADKLWNAWKRGRNQVFHFYPTRYQPLTLLEAKDIVREIMEAMETALVECNIK